MADECGVHFLGSVPIDTTFGALTEGGDRELVERYRSCGLCGIFEGYAGEVVNASREGIRPVEVVEVEMEVGVAVNGSGP